MGRVKSKIFLETLIFEIFEEKYLTGDRKGNLLYTLEDYLLVPQLGEDRVESNRDLNSKMLLTAFA